jgi:hypothetical protein
MRNPPMFFSVPAEINSNSLIFFSSSIYPDNTLFQLTLKGSFTKKTGSNPDQ